MPFNRAILLVLPFLLNIHVSAQNSDTSVYIPNQSSKEISNKTTIPEKDIVDVIKALPIVRKLHKKPESNENTLAQPHFTVLPAGGYTLQTGFAVLLAANLVFYSNPKDLSKASTFFTSIAFTQKNQVILPLFANYWSKNNNYNFISDNRYMNYPTVNYGIGPRAIESNGSNIDYSYLKLHETLLRRIYKNTYLGGGVFYDYFWNIKEDNPPVGTATPFKRYGPKNKELAVGLVAKFLFDNRINQVNPAKGFMASIIFRENLKLIGSDENWRASIIELKKYIPFPAKSKNVIALWSYNSLTFGKGRSVPYLLLPSTGWDDFFNTGRGYVQGRFKGGNMTYLEAEYRFQLLKNGLLGGVVFGNVQSFSKELSNGYSRLIPGYGLGLRIKMNKASATNLCIDYGFGINGSSGFFVNLGEVF